MDEVKTASAVAPMRRRGTTLVVDEVPTQAPDFAMNSLSFSSDNDLIANLSPALRAARVKAQCPPKAAVRAGNLCGGVPLTAEPLQPTPQGGRQPDPGRRWASPRRLERSGAFARDPAPRPLFTRRKHEVPRPTFAVTPNLERVNAFPS